MQEIKIMALGGLDEEGKNMYVLEIDQDIFIIEAGLKYPNGENRHGVGYQIPDFNYLNENKERIKAIFITHGHNDVMCALPHLLKAIDIPVYATDFTNVMLQHEFKKHNISHDVNIIKRNDLLKISGHEIKVFPMIQSIVDGVGLSFDTEKGQIVYAGEFIVDYNEQNPHFAMDFKTLYNISTKPVLALLAESNYVKKEGYTSPKHRLHEKLEKYFDIFDNRLIISVYKQNVYRIMEIIELAFKYNKRVYFHDQSQIELLRTLSKLGYYNIPNYLIVDNEHFDNEDENTVIVVSGNGNKVFKTLNKIALSEDKKVFLRKSDIVVIGSPIVPGTEKDASTMEDDLYRSEVKIVKFHQNDVLSIHASKEDLKTLIHLVKPKFYIPIEGDYSKLYENAKLAIDSGISVNRIIVVDNGQFIKFKDGKLVSTSEKISLEDIYIDSSDRQDVSSLILKERDTLSTEGVVIVGVVIDNKTKKIISGTDIQSRGVIYLKDFPDLMSSIMQIPAEVINDAVSKGSFNNALIRSEIKEKVSKAILKTTGKKPLVISSILEVKNG